MSEPREPDAKHRAKVSLLRRALTARGRSLEITKAGWLFIVLTLAVGFAAINSGSNLLHVLFGCQLGMIIASGILSESMVQRARVKRKLASPLYAGRPGALEIELANGGRRGDMLAVSVEDDDRYVDLGSTGPVFSVAVSPGTPTRLHTTVTMPRRGRHLLPPTVVATRFPFGLFVKRRDVPRGAEVLVYPSIHPVEAREVREQARGEGDAAAGLDARAGEIYGLDQYREGDDLRRIAWGATARLGRTVVYEFESHGEREAWLSLSPGRTGEPGFEHRVEEVASLAVALLRDGRVATGLRYGGDVLIPPGVGPAHERRLLDALAVIGHDPDRGAEAGEATGSAATWEAAA